MPLYVIERSIPDGLGLAPTHAGRQAAEAIRKAAERNKLPVERITEVRLLDPYFHM